jgi:predicted NAD-dependent protein-ADP-ribosyltransferase YbiA (DUF1768 family)
LEQDEMNGLPADSRILYFARDRAQYGFLFHFHAAPIALDGEIWPTVEHFYQAQKSDDPDYRAAILQFPAPIQASSQLVTARAAACYREML